MKDWKRHFPRFNFTDEAIFVEACRVAGVGPSDRQRAKWRCGRGDAYSKRTTARRRLAQAGRRREGSLK